MKTHAIEIAKNLPSPRAPSKKFLIQTPNGFRLIERRSHKNDAEHVFAYTIFMNQNKGIALTVAAQFLAVAGAAGAHLKYGVDLYAYVVPTTLIIAVIGMKVVKPTIPSLEIAALALIIFAIHVLTHLVIFNFNWPIWWHLLSELVIIAVCVQVFGLRWIKAGHISKMSCFWPE